MKLENFKAKAVTIRQTSESIFSMFINSTGSIFDPRFKCAWIKQAGLNEKAVLNEVSSEIKIRCDLLRSSEF